MKFELTILGTSAAVPTKNRYLSGQVLNVQDELFLIDCGEGTQFRLSEFQIKRTKINRIFISHLHGDHFFGLFGILTSLAMTGRTEPMDIFSPNGLEEIVKVMFKNSMYESPFKINFHVIRFELGEKSTLLPVFENSKLTVCAFPLWHRIPAVGYLFTEKKVPRHIIADKITELHIPYDKINAIKNGADFNLKDSLLPELASSNLIIPNELLTEDSPAPRSFAYCSDTRYFEAILPHVQGVDMLYHEATFAHEMSAHAHMTGHSTAHQAALIAQKAGVKKLIIGHFSSRYDNLDVLLNEARNVFENTVLAIDGNIYPIE